MPRFWTAMKAAIENVTQGRQTAPVALDQAAKRIKGGS